MKLKITSFSLYKITLRNVFIENAQQIILITETNWLMNRILFINIITIHIMNCKNKCNNINTEKIDAAQIIESTR